MNYNTQNKKIASITEKTLVVGIDVGSQTHYARAFDWRNFEYSKKAFAFENNESGFQAFKNRINELYDTPTAEGTTEFKPNGHDIVFDHVRFSYDKKDVLQNVSFTAREARRFWLSPTGCALWKMQTRLSSCQKGR